MKILIPLLLLLLSYQSFAACSSSVSRNNYVTNQVLTSSALNTDFNQIVTRINELDGDCITDSSIPLGKLEAASVAKSKLAADALDETVLAKTAAYIVLNTDRLVTADATSAAFTLTLPAAASISGRVLKFKKLDSTVNAVTIDGNAAETIDGIATFVLGGQYQAVEIVSNGTNWIVVSASRYRSEVFLTGGNGHGSTSTKIRRFVTTVKVQGGDITDSGDSATLGRTLTINSAGNYATSYCDTYSGSTGFFGISVNSAQLTTTVSTATNADVLTIAQVAAANVIVCSSATTFLNAGDVVRPHSDGLATGTSDYQVKFRITKVN